VWACLLWTHDFKSFESVNILCNRVNATLLLVVGFKCIYFVHEVSICDTNTDFDRDTCCVFARQTQFNLCSICLYSDYLHVSDIMVGLYWRQTVVCCFIFSSQCISGFTDACEYSLNLFCSISYFILFMKFVLFFIVEIQIIMSFWFNYMYFHSQKPFSSMAQASNGKWSFSRELQKASTWSWCITGKHSLLYLGVNINS
jgi:hypothetical protein